LSESTVVDATRIHQWWLPKATNLLVVLYASMILAAPGFAESLCLLALSFMTIIGIASFGHVVNDWSDIAADQRAGKRNPLAAIGRGSRWALLALALAIGLLPWIYLPMTAVSAQLLVLEFALFIAYSVPPVRLKERGVWAAVTDASYACAVPAVLAAYTSFMVAGQNMPLILFIVLPLWQLALGVRHYLNHLAVDRINDIASATTTLATLRGNRFLHDLIRKVVLPIEFVAFLGFLLVVGAERAVMLVVLLAAFLALSAVNIVLTLGRSYPLIVYRFSSSNMDRIYQLVLPLSLLAVLAFDDWRFSLFFIIHLLPVLPWQRVLQDGSPAIAAAEQDLRENPMHASRERPADNERLSIAVANINKGKYTETFVTGLIGQLDFNVHYLHGGELPRFDGDDRHFLSNWPSLQLLIRYLESALRLGEDYFLSSSIAGYLQAKRVKLVLAQFGPVGVQMLPIARDLGIPLIVNFHGYDAFNSLTVERCTKGYQRLFLEADRIIGVSESMLQRLRDLGAPADKLIHLPAYVNLELFPFLDRGKRGPRFLAVGRFAETKSPHLTILAFRKVVDRVDDATLTLIGKGGGGELFEACRILVKALDLEKHVVFKGALAHRQVAEEMQQARVFVQHSITTPEHGDREGKPVAVMEAMASGMPVVATRHAGIEELIEHNVSGFLVDEYDVRGMADAMVMLALNDDQARSMGEHASRSIHGDPLISEHVTILQNTIRESIARN